MLHISNKTNQQTVKYNEVAKKTQMLIFVILCYTTLLYVTNGIKDLTIDLSNKDVYQLSDVTFEFTVENAVPQSSLFEISFPSGFDLIESTIPLTQASGINVEQVCRHSTHCKKLGILILIDYKL